MKSSKGCLMLLTLASFSTYQHHKVRAEDKTELPLYYGWFVEKDFSSSFIRRSLKTLSDSLEAVPEFMADVRQFTGKLYISDILTHYARPTPEEVLHCTAAYNGVYPNYTPGAEEYANSPEVKERLKKDSLVRSIGWFLTNRTFGARIYLDEDQLLVWNQDDNEGNPTKTRMNEKEMRDAHEQGCITAQNPMKETIVNQEDGILGSFKPTSGKGSRAHLTLGCAPGVSAVNTGYDLVDLIRLEQEADDSIPTYNLSESITGGGGWLRNYGEGQWVFYPKKQWLLNSTFLGYDTESDTDGSVNLNGSTLLLVSLSSLVLFFMDSTLL